MLAAHLVHFVASQFPGITWRPWLTCNLALHGVLLVLGGPFTTPIFPAGSATSSA